MLDDVGYGAKFGLMHWNYLMLSIGIHHVTQKWNVCIWNKSSFVTGKNGE